MEPLTPATKDGPLEAARSSEAATPAGDLSQEKDVGMAVSDVYDNLDKIGESSDEELLAIERRLKRARRM